MSGTTEKTLCKFADVEQAEHERLRQIRAEQGREAADDANRKLIGLTGLALSGGGIRAAAFSLGILHSLKKRGLHYRLDYLSTVSGGGYIGAAWSYAEALRAEANQKEAEPSAECLRERILPLGQRHVGGKLEGGEQNRYLDHIRGHGHYLEIGHELGFGSLVAMLLRSIVVGLLIWLPLAILGLSLLATMLDAIACGISWLWPSPAPAVAETADAVSKAASPPAFGESIGLLLPAALVLLGIMALFAVWRCVTTNARGTGDSYVNRITQQRHLGWLWRRTLGLAVLGSLPAATTLMSELSEQLGALLAGPVGIVGGALAAWILMFKIGRLQRGGFGGWPLLANLGAGLMLFGGLVIALELARHLNDLGRWLLGWAAVSRWETDPFMATMVELAPAIVLGLVALWIAARTDINIIALNRLYRDRLMEAFLPNPNESGKWHEATDADRFWLWETSPEGGKAPYHLINTHVILTRSASTRHAGRGGDSFVLAPLYCGSDATDWCPTKEWIRRKGPDDYLSLPTAMAISGAAINPDAGESGRGPTRLRFVAMAMSLLNLRLAYWVPNPMKCGAEPVSPRLTWLKIGLHVLLGNAHKETNGFVELSDGQHFEGLGLYELIRRRVEIIVVADATCDPAFGFQALGNAIERCRVDFGVDIRFADRRFCLDDLLPRPNAPHIPLEAASFAHAGVAIARIDYPQTGEHQEAATGHLVYIKSTLIRDLPPDLLAYKLADPTFPDQSTLDQSFDEAQFEAYRELGYGLLESFMRRLDSHERRLDPKLVAWLRSGTASAG